MGRAREISDAPGTFCAQARDSVNDEVPTTLLRIRPLPPGPLRAPTAARGTGHAAHAQGLRYASALRREQQFAAYQRRDDRSALARQLRGREQPGSLWNSHRLFEVIKSLPGEAVVRHVEQCLTATVVVKG